MESNGEEYLGIVASHEILAYNLNQVRRRIHALTIAPSLDDCQPARRRIRLVKYGHGCKENEPESGRYDHVNE